MDTLSVEDFNTIVAKHFDLLTAGYRARITPQIMENLTAIASRITQTDVSFENVEYDQIKEQLVKIYGDYITANNIEPKKYF